MADSNKTRWEKAQKCELDWWKSHKGNADWYRSCAELVEAEVNPYLQIDKDTKILEIGSGPAGPITFLNSKNKYAIDPLEYYFSSIKSYTDIRDPSVKYTTGKGEELPYESNFFDLIIIDNVLEHCENSEKVLDEIERAIKLGSVIFIRQHTYQWWGKQIRSLVESLQMDKAHAFTFTEKQMEDEFKNRGWIIRKKIAYSYFKIWLNDLKSMTAKGLIKSCLFMPQSPVIYILQNKAHL